MNEKGRLRLQVESRRAALSADSHRMKSEQMCRRAIEYLKRVPLLINLKQPLLAYLPFRSEPDLSLLLQWSWAEGIPLAVPRTEAEGRRLEPCLITSVDDVEVSGPWGIREPKPGCTPLAGTDPIGCIVIPGLAFDADKGRLGYGGGYYDRYLRRLEERDGKLPLTIALAFDDQLVAQVPMEEHDYRVDMIITESTTIL